MIFHNESNNKSNNRIIEKSLNDKFWIRQKNSQNQKQTCITEINDFAKTNF